MTGRPEPSEAAPYYFTYIDQVTGEDIIPILGQQLEETLAVGSSVSEGQSLYRYAHDKWTIREVLNHINDAERVFASRAFWFARGLDTSLPSFDQEIAVRSAEADEVPWSAHVEEFRRVRLASISLFENMPASGWMRGGIASDKHFSVRPMAYIIAGHLSHHIALLRERYLQDQHDTPIR